MFLFDTCNAVAAREDRKPKYFGFQSSRAATALHVSKKNITFCFNQG